VAVTT
jgi:hypothetical protein